MNSRSVYTENKRFQISLYRQRCTWEQALVRFPTVASAGSLPQAGKFFDYECYAQICNTRSFTIKLGLLSLEGSDLKLADNPQNKIWVVECNLGPMLQEFYLRTPIGI
jgi:hypothetical protein